VETEKYVTPNFRIIRNQRKCRLIIHDQRKKKWVSSASANHSVNYWNKNIQETDSNKEIRSTDKFVGVELKVN